MKIKTNALTGRVLDWAVCLAIGGTVNEGNTEVVAPNNGYYLLSNGRGNFTPSSDWSICGQLIDYYSIDLSCEIETTGTTWSAKEYYYSNGWSYAETPQIAICRAVVIAQLGDEVEIPSELMEKNNDQ